MSVGQGGSCLRVWNTSDAENRQLSEDQKELAFQAKDAALRCLDIFLRSQSFRAHLKCAYNTLV